MTILFYSRLVEKFVKFIHKKKNIEKLFDFKNLNEKIKLVCDKIERLENNINVSVGEDVVIMQNENENAYCDLLNNTNSNNQH